MVEGDKGAGGESGSTPSGLFTRCLPNIDQKPVLVLSIAGPRRTKGFRSLGNEDFR